MIADTNMNNKELTTEIQRLAAIVEKTAVPVPIIPTAVAVVTGDHELLQRLDVKVDALKEDIKNMTEGTSIKLNDHEARLRINESSITRILTYGSAGLILLGIIQFLLSYFKV